jgi:hypothetical protein
MNSNVTNELTTKDSDVEAKALQESEKLYFDSMKHLTTLNTGSILLLITFLEKLFQKPEWKFLVVVSLSIFVLSNICSISSMVQSANYIKHSANISDSALKIKDLLHYLSLITFLFGILLLTIFAIKNIN